jgi:transposase
MANKRKAIDIGVAALMYRGGATLAEVAQEFGVSPRTIMLRLRERKVPIRKRGQGPRAGQHSRVLSDEQEAELAQRYRAGEFSGELARAFGVGRHAILNALQRQGITKRDKQNAQAALNSRRREKGERHPNFKGGRVTTQDSYILVGIDETDPLWSMATERRRKEYAGYIGTGYVLEHRLVMARHLGRPLSRQETVHHVNGNRSDNRLENLQLRTGKHGAGKALCCADCGSRNIVSSPLE